jgi:hypothetical protein
MITRLLIISLLSLASLLPATGQVKPDSVKPAPAPPKVEWYKKLSIRGYAQIRYNRLLETNNDLGCEQCDRSWGGNGGFFIRRARIIFFGQVHERVYVYIQPDFASSPSSSTDNNNFGQLRDAYFDLGIDKKNEYRLRIGQSKVPFGFENLQSSQNRLPLDRNDALNSAVSNERDLGIFFYWAPTKIRERFSTLVSSGLKGSGDYGVLGLGLYNGQTANRADRNEESHFVARLTYPIEIGRQIIEPGIQGYSGKFVVPSVTAANDVTGKKDFEYYDERVAATFVLYPQPFGILAEYNIGTGPEYNPETNSVDQKKLTGGHVQASYFAKIKDHIIIPFVRYQYYDGGKKHEKDARSYNVRELEIGAEWQPMKTPISLTIFRMEACFVYKLSSTFNTTANQSKQKASPIREAFCFLNQISIRKMTHQP